MKALEKIIPYLTITFIIASIILLVMSTRQLPDRNLILRGLLLLYAIIIPIIGYVLGYIFKLIDKVTLWKSLHWTYSILYGIAFFLILYRAIHM